MSDLSPIVTDPTLDLTLERVVPLSPQQVWDAWTKPELLKQWFCPKPWGVSDAVIDLRPGGRFFTMMRSPEGTEHPNDGCFLEVVPGRRLVFTDALKAGYRPGTSAFMTAVVTMEPHADGTRYVATAMHADVATREKHEAMGFAVGWGMALDQLVALFV